MVTPSETSEQDWTPWYVPRSPSTIGLEPGNDNPAVITQSAKSCYFVVVLFGDILRPDTYILRIVKKCGCVKSDEWMNEKGLSHCGQKSKTL